ncbi:MAG: hypothetical protein ACLPOO_05440 [Terriglobales bacterium]|jgi:hypothetical protein
MEMFLMGLCMAVFGMGIAAVAFGAATRSESTDSAVQPALSLAKADAPAHFFSDRAAAQTPAPPAVPPAPAWPVPIEVLLLQIENHVRMEQAAAESFLAFPTHDLLHTKTTSPFVN